MQRKGGPYLNLPFNPNQIPFKGDKVVQEAVKIVKQGTEDIIKKEGPKLLDAVIKIFTK